MDIQHLKPNRMGRISLPLVFLNLETFRKCLDTNY